MGCVSAKPVYEMSHTKNFLEKINGKNTFPVPPLGSPPISPPAPPPSPIGKYDIR